MAEYHHGRDCFYCGIRMVKRGSFTSQFGVKVPPNLVSRDHVYPKSRMGHLDKSLHAHNLVKCCEECNQYKGHLQPLDWLVIMPDDAGADRLYCRLVVLGENKVDLDAAMRRRA